MEDNYLTTDQVAKILQVHPFTILKFIKNGKLKGVKLGRVYRLKKTDVDDFIENMTVVTKRSGVTKVVPERSEGTKESLIDLKEATNDNSSAPTNKVQIEEPKQEHKEPTTQIQNNIPPKETYELTPDLLDLKDNTNPDHYYIL